MCVYVHFLASKLRIDFVSFAWFVIMSFLAENDSLPIFHKSF
tara:strand:- start:156546 stop:156671 length:126 start_codon:yes stop_codon:yes gene_type:complete